MPTARLRNTVSSGSGPDHDEPTAGHRLRDAPRLKQQINALVRYQARQGPRKAVPMTGSGEDPAEHRLPDPITRICAGLTPMSSRALAVEAETATKSRRRYTAGIMCRSIARATEATGLGNRMVHWSVCT